MTRREALTLLALANPGTDGPLPPVSALLARTLRLDPGSLNTDWFGTCLVHGLLAWSQRGFPEAGQFARRWLDFHLAHKGLSPYSGNRSRVVEAGGIVLTTYAGHFGLAFPCFELFRQFRDQRARRICLDIARIILHQTARNRYGMVLHDDTSEFTIPDVCYFVAPPLMIASALGGSSEYRDQALYQLRTYTDIFLDRRKGLAKTILLKDGLGSTYWTRASGWLLWSITGVLEHLRPPDPRILEDLRVLAAGIVRAQDASGALRLFLDDPSSPLETTGTAMAALAIHQSVRRGWLPDSFAPAAARAWSYVQGRITPDGRVTGAYTGWAVPAENRVIEMDQVDMGWIPGFLLRAAAECG